MSSLFDLPFEEAPLEPEPALEPEREPQVEPRAETRVEPPIVPAAAVRATVEPPAPGAGPAPPAPRARPRIYSVSEVTHAVRRQLEQAFAAVWVEGEVADCTPSQPGHIYFTLKDAGAQLKVVLWRTEAARLRFKLTTGLHVLVRGRLSVYPQRGIYQLTADSIEPRGAGALQLAFEQLKARLQAEGLFAPSRKRPLPLLPRRIGVVTSLDGAALRDIVRVLRTRHAPADIVISPARVQGDGAAAEIARALRRLAGVPGVDVIIVGRGGGSIEDLWAFNEEVVARALAACPVPTIAAVGHEVDTTIADFVADVRAATPSQAAELVVRQASEFRDRIAGSRRQMQLLVRGQLERRRTQLLRLEQRPAFAHIGDQVRNRERLRLELAATLEARWRAATQARHRRLADATQRLEEQHPQRQLTSRMRRLAALDERLQAATRATPMRAQARLAASRQRLAGSGLDHRLAQARRRVDHHISRIGAAMTSASHDRDRHLSMLSAQLDALSPLRTLARGYAICWDASHTRLVRSVAAVMPGDRIHVQLPDGELQCAVDDSPSTAAPRP